jgi:hypothetical protein
LLQREVVIRSFDVIALAGATLTAYVATIPGVVVGLDGAAVLGFTSRVENPQISGFEFVVAASQDTLVRMTSPGPRVLGINCGGSAFTDGQGNPWLDDVHFVGGNVGTEIVPVVTGAGSLLPMYNTSRYWTGTGTVLAYSIPLSPGNYTVRLHVCNAYEGAPASGAHALAHAPAGTSAVGQRVYDISVLGQSLVLDVIEAAGQLTAYAHTFAPVTVNSSGLLSVTVLSYVQNPQLSGIEVFQAYTAAPTAGKPLRPRSLPALRHGRARSTHGCAVSFAVGGTLLHTHLLANDEHAVRRSERPAEPGPHGCAQRCALGRADRAAFARAHRRPIRPAHACPQQPPDVRALSASLGRAHRYA